MITVEHVSPKWCRAWGVLRCALWPDADPLELQAEAEVFVANPGTGVGAMPEAVLIAVDAATEQLAGFAELSRRAYADGCRSSPVAYLEAWYVAPAYRRRGVGRQLIRTAESWATALGCHEFASDALVDNTLSARAHEGVGFEEVEVIRLFRKPLTGE